MYLHSIAPKTKPKRSEEQSVAYLRRRFAGNGDPKKKAKGVREKCHENGEAKFGYENVRNLLIIETPDGVQQ